MFSSVTALPFAVSGNVGGLVSEAVSLLNGAHLSGASRLGNLVRKYHHSGSPGHHQRHHSQQKQKQAAGLSSSAFSSCPSPPSSSSSSSSSSVSNQQGCSSVSNDGGLMLEDSKSVKRKKVYAELGLSSLPSDIWRNAVSQQWAGLTTADQPNNDVTAHDIIKNGLRSSRSFGGNWNKRQLFTRSVTNSSLSLRSAKPSLLLVSRGYASLAHLEDRANFETDNPRVQARYLEAVLNQDPRYVIRRFESGKFAVDSEMRKIYQKALRMAEEEEEREREREKAAIGGGSSVLGSIRLSSSTSQADDALGSKENPVHVLSTVKKGGFMKEVLSLARFIVLAFLLSTLFSSAILTQVKNSTQQMTKDFRPDMSEKLYSFQDVQGVDEAKAELQEVVEFLKCPERFQKLGAKLPTGVLLIGPPGTGKTLLAKAIAGEADVPFFFASGSEFDEMFVGVGAARMRKLFEQARRHKPCVVFIDELDAVGGARVATSIHPYSRMTLNQLLVEMDGYQELEGVVIVGATNFPESLDKALIRPGRFDSRVNIPLPDVRARFKILEVHSKKVKMSEEVDLEVIARGTSGFSGADLANLINQAALKGSADGKEAVSMEELDYAKDKIIMGPERKSAVIEQKNKELVAYHEGGHAILALFTPEATPIHKATIVPRGDALGMVVQLPEKDELSWTKRQLLARMDVAMGGRVAEEMVFGPDNITSGASSDLEAATKIARVMVTRMGMSELVGPVSHGDPEKMSSSTNKLIEDEVKRLLKESYERAQQVLRTHSKEHKLLAEALLKYETLDAEEIKLVVASKPLTRKI